MSANSNNAFDMSVSQAPNGRPTTGYRAPSARPSTSHFSRIGTASQSRGGPPLLQNASTGSSSHRIGTALGYAGNIMAAERPLTQHGLSGLPTTASMGAMRPIGTATGGRLGTSALGSSSGGGGGVGMRQIKDKRYWMAQLQLKMNEIQRESERLAAERDAMHRERSAKRSFEKRVQETAKQLTALQAELADTNIVLDAHSSGFTRAQLQQETAALRDLNERTQAQLEQQFDERQQRSAANAELQALVGAERQRIDDLVFALPAVDQQRYRVLQASSEPLHAQLAESQERNAAAAGQLGRLQATVAQSTQRAEAVRLLAKHADLVQRLQALRTEEAQRPSPAQEREQLIAEVRENNQSLQGFNNQLRLVDAQLHEKRELLGQIDQDLQEGQSDRHAKYKELKRRDETMTAFMATFAERAAIERRNVDRLKERITYGIEQITVQGINLKQFGIAADAERNDLGTQDGLVREYKRLSVQLQQLQLLERRTNAQLSELRAEELRCTEDTQRYGDLAAVREESAARMNALADEAEQLQKKKATTAGVVEEARRSNDELKAQLSANERYRQISHLEERLSDVLRSNADAQQLLDEHRREYDYGALHAKVEQQVSTIMEMLQSAS